MQLPWTQLTKEGKRRAKAFGRMVGVGPHAGVGFVSDLWDAALELAPDGDFSGRFPDPEVLIQYAGGLPEGCTKDPLGVVEVLQRVGLMATHPDLRVVGLDRYASTWKNNRKPRKHDRPLGDPKVSGPQDEDEDLDVDVDLKDDRSGRSGSKERSPSEAQELLEGLELQREKHCLALGIDPGKPERFHPAKINSLIAKLVTPDLPLDHIRLVHDLYLADEFGRVDTRQKPPIERVPPWPTALFLNAANFARYVEKFEAQE